jgi:uncharacterized protein
LNSVHDTAITCAACEACCCKLQVLLMAGDDVPGHLTDNDQWNTASMRRRSDGWCAALSRDTLLCTIYSRRPMICREFAMGGSDCIDARALHPALVPGITIGR